MKYIFGKEIKKRRIEKSIDMDILCYGLCSISMMNLIESGERTPDRLMCNRLMDRLGISEDDYEIYLDDDDYVQWLERQKIVGAFIDEDIVLVNKLLDDYEHNNDMKNKMCIQFLSFMCGEAYRMAGKESGTFFEQAVKLTIPEIDTRKIGELCLSVQELNMVLEYAEYKSADERSRLYKEVFDYIEGNFFDIHNISKIYPKLIYYICRDDAAECIFERTHENKDMNIRKAKYLNLCNKAIDILREACRTYYLLELLDVKIKLILEIIDNADLNNSEKNYTGLKKQLDETEKWKELYSELYKRAGISGYMESDVYSYFEGMAYNVSDIVRIRRRMLGMTAKELADGICSTRTVLRIENKQCKVHRDIARELLQKLGVTYQLYRTDLVSENADAQKLRQKFDEVYYAKRGGYDECLKCIQDIREVTDDSILINSLTLNFITLVSKYAYGKIIDKEFGIKIKELLECTVSYDAVMSSEDIFLTNNEIRNLREIITLKEKDCFELCKKIYEFYENMEKKTCIHPYIIVYEYIMETISSCYGDFGIYGESNDISKKIQKMCLKCRRTHKVPILIYNNVWNNKMKDKREKYNEQEKKELDKCIILSEFIKNDARKQLYEKKKNS